MTDYGHDLRFGVFLTPTTDDPDRVIGLAQLAEDVGLDLVSVQDHPYQQRHLDTWTLLSVIAGRTHRISVAPNVASLPLRPPAVLAKSAATLDVLSGGRVELGLGTGAFWDGIVAMGGERRSPREAVEALTEAIGVIRAMWSESGETVRIRGDHYTVYGARPGPAPLHRIEIWVGAYKPRMLALTGRLADGWLPSTGYVEPDELGPRNARIDEAAQAAGRDPSEIRRLYNIAGTFSGPGTDFLRGTPSVWVEQLSELTVDEGISTYILASDDPDTIRRFAAEVAPGVRELVGVERATPPEQRDLARPAPSQTQVVSPHPLAVVPTPDDGVRLSPAMPWDEAGRPEPRTVETGRTYTAYQQSIGQHLVDVHDMLRAELRQLREIVDQVAAGTLGPGPARSAIHAMTMRQNNWTLGTYCESYCRLVAGHHGLEDASVFPHLRAREPDLTPVLDRLADEHVVIHDVLESVDRALVQLVSTGDDIKPLLAAMDLLTDTLLSHLSYEERALVEPLARHGFA